jgi:hypothetical protein
VPLIVVQTADNQREGFRTVDAAHAALCAPAAWLDEGVGTVEDRFLSLFRRALDPDVRRALSARARRLVDGQGGRRLVDRLVGAGRDTGMSAARAGMDP